MGIMHVILLEIKSELNMRKRKTGIDMALNDNKVGRKLHGPKSIFPFNRKYISPVHFLYFNIKFLFSSLEIEE